MNRNSAMRSALYSGLDYCVRKAPVSRALAVLIACSFFPAAARTQDEVLVDFLDGWNYVLGTEAPSTPATAWRTPAFNDAAWVQDAPSPIGYGGAAKNIRTTLPTSAAGGYLTVYFRQDINVDDASAFTALILDIEFDDGFVCYVNGTEAGRFNMGAPGEEFAFDDTSTAGHEATDEPTTFDISAGLAALQDGNNVIAFEVHNTNATSSDLVFNARITGSTDIEALCPTSLTCARRADGVQLDWVNNPTVNYTGIVVRRDGTPIPGSPFSGSTESVVDAAGSDRPRNYTVVAQIGAFNCPPLACTTTDTLTIVGPGDEWNFFRGTVDPSVDPGTLAADTVWTTPAFDDSTWETGPSGFGYGDGDDATVLDDMEGGYTTVYLRRTVTASAAELSASSLGVDYDDGFVAYLNGTEIARANIGVAGDIPIFDGVAGGNHEAGLSEYFPIPAGVAVSGANTLAIVGFNTAIDSSDFSLIPSLVTNPDLTPLCPDPMSLSCERTPAAVILTWVNNPAIAYDRIEVYRNGTQIAGSPFPGEAETATDASGQGGASYEVVAIVGGAECPVLECVAPAEVRYVSEGEDWSFFRGTAEPTPDAGNGAPTTAWTELGFDDSLWELGPSGFGYADNDDATVLDDMQDTYTSLYIRKSLQLNNVGALGDLLLAIDYDDSFVAYWNGDEFARSGVAENPPAFDAVGTNHEANGAEFFIIDNSILQSGENVLAIHGLNAAIDSSDFSLIPEVLSGLCVPVQGLVCSADPDASSVTLTWDTELHDQFVVLRNGAQIPGSPFGSNTGVAVDNSPSDGDNVYQVIGRVGGSPCPASTCTVTCVDLFPEDLTCDLSSSAGRTRAQLSWTINPPGTGLIDVVLDGAVIDTLNPGASSYTIPDVAPDPLATQVDLQVRFLDSTGDTLCTISCGASSLCPEMLVCSSDGVDIELQWGNVVRSWQSFTVLRDGVEVAAGLPGTSTSYTDVAPPIQPGIPVTYTVQPIGVGGDDSICALQCTTTLSIVEAARYVAPAGGWDYFSDFGAGTDQYQPTPLQSGNLDGSWIRAAEDSWDGSAPLEVGAAPAGAAPGGIATQTVPGEGTCSGDATVLRLLDPGDPSAPGASLATEHPDVYDAPNNQAFVLGRDLGVSARNLLRDGVTFAARWRVNPDAPDYLAAQPTGDGSPISGGLGQLGIVFVNDGSLVGQGDAASLGVALNSNDLLQFSSNPVQTVGAASITTFRSVWITVEDPEGDDTYEVHLYTNGQNQPFGLVGRGEAVVLQTPDADLGAAAGNFLYIAQRDVGNDGDVQIDWIAYKAGVHLPDPTLCSPCGNSQPTALAAVSPSADVELSGGTASITLDSAGSNDGNGGAQGLDFLWSKIAGPGGETIATPSAASTTVELTGAGTYVFRLRVDDGQSCLSSAVADVVVTVTDGDSGIFRRGDVDAGGDMAITDAIALFNFLFIGNGIPPTCPDAADADDNGALGITDGIRILNVLFQGVGVIPAPGFIDCGPDEVDDALGECVYDAC